MASLSVVKLELNKGANNMGFGSALKKAMTNAGYIKKVEPTTTATAKPAMRYAPLDLSDTGGPSLNLKNKKALNPSLQAPMTLYDRQMLKGR